MFTVHGQLLNNLLAQSAKVVGKEPADHVQIKGIPGKGLTIITHDAGRIVRHTLSCNVEKKCLFRLPLDRLMLITAKRTSMKFNMRKDGQLSYSGDGSYSGTLETLEPKDLSLTAPGVSTTLSDTLRRALFDISKHVALKPQFINREMLLFVELKDKDIAVACGDGQHVGLATTRGEEAENHQSLTFPLSYVQLIQSVFSKTETLRMSADQSHLHFIGYGKDAQTNVALPLVDTSNESITLERVQSLFAEQDKLKPDLQADVNMEEINVCLGNMEGIKDKEKSSELIIATTKDGLLGLAMVSRHGQIKQKLTAQPKGKGQIFLNPLTASDVFNKVKGRATMRLVGGRLCLLEAAAENAVRLRYLILGIQPIQADER